jgi:hypothetical protein
MADGRLSIEITAIDGSGKKTITPPMVYWIDNTPPVVEMQVPRPKYKDAYTIDVDDPPAVVAGSPLAGLISDDQGIARGYPLIKFWRADQNEPLHDNENAGMPLVITGDWHGADDGWIRPDKGYLPPEGPDEKPIAMAIMYYTAEHHEGGKPFSEQPEEEYKLDPNVRYKLKIKVADLGGHEIMWPPQRSGTENEAGKYDLDHIVVFLDTTGNPPLIELTTDPEGQFQRQNFKIKASAEPRDPAEDIQNLSIRVAGKKKDGISTGWVTLASVASTGLNTASNLEFNVEYGKTYTNQSEFPDLTKEEWENHADSVSITFKDGSFQFEANALTTGSGSRGRESLGIYLDQQPPLVAFTQVDPYFEMRDIAGTDGYRLFTVNGTINVNVSSTDNRGNAVIDGIEVPKADDRFTGFERFKYLLRKDAEISAAPGKTMAETLYEHQEARFFEDNSENEAVTVSGGDGAYTLQIQTDNYDDIVSSDDKEYNLWLYIVAQDNAKNMNWARILLDVNQDTDNPVISYGNLSDLGTSFSNETLIIQVTVKDDDGFNETVINDIRYAAKGAAAYPPVQYRYNSNAGTDKTAAVLDDDPDWEYVENTGTTWYTLPEKMMQLSADNKTITINLSVQEILPNIFGKDWNTVYKEKKLQDYYGSEDMLKAIEFRSYDAVNRKVLPSDGTAKRTATRKFTVDFTWPEIVRHDPVDKPKDWFMKPGFNEAFKETFLANGYLREMYFQAFQVVIDGAITLTISPPGASGGDPGAGVPEYDAWVSSDKKNPMVVKAQEWTSTDPKLQWFFPMDYDDPSDSPDKGPLWAQLAEGPHIFQFTLTDWAGNADRRQVSFYKDGVGPAIGFNNLNQIEEKGTMQYPRLSDKEWRYWGDPVANAGLLTSAEQTALKDKMKALSALNDQKARLMGNFTDEYSNVGTTYWWRLEKFVAKAYDSPGTDKKFWDTEADSGKGGWINFGKWNATSLTSGGNKNEAFAIAIPSNEYDPVTNEVITDNDGLYRVSIRVRDSEGNGFTNTSAPGPGDTIGLGYEENVAFSVDRIPPEVKITKVTLQGDATDRKDEADLVVSPAGVTGNVITITGTAKDAFLENGEAAAIIRNSSNTIILGSADSYGSDKIVINLSDGASGNEDIWAITLTRDQFDAYMNADGAYTLTITFKDGGAREGTKTWAFIRDGTAPEITYNNLIRASTAILSEMNPRIQGLASDANLIKGLKYRLEKNTNTHAAPVWTAVSENGKTPDAGKFVDFDAAVTSILTSGGAAYINWSRTMDIPASNLGGDGEYRVAVYARDNALLAGNENLLPASVADTDWIYFVVDRAPPVLTVADTLAYYGSAGISLSGTASDASGLKPLEAYVKGFESSAPAPVTVNETNGLWDIRIDTSTHSSIGGAQTLVVRVEDNVGHSTEVTRNFIYDATHPYVVIEEPRAEASIDPGKYNTQGAVNGEITLRGRTDDDSSVARVLYHIGEKVSAPKTDPGYNISNVFEVKASQVIAHPGGENVYKILTKGDTDWTLLGAPAGYNVGTIFTPIMNGSTLPGVATEGTAELWIDTLLDSRDHPNWNGTLYSFTRTFADFNIYGSAAFSSTELGVDADGNYTVGTTVEAPSPANPTGKNRWKVPVYFKIIDLAGNEWDFGGDSGNDGVIDMETRPGISPIEKDYWIIVDRYLDKPTVNLLSPMSGSRVGGQQRLAGTAKDDDYVFQVEYRLNGKPENALVNGFPADNDPGWAKYPGDSGVPAFAGLPVPSNDFGPDGTTLLSGGWRAAGLPSAGVQASWWVNINSGGEYTPPAGQDREVYIQIRAMDTKDPRGSIRLNSIYGDTANYVLTFDSGVPVISTPRIKWYDDRDPSLGTTHLVGEGDYTAQMQVSRTFVLEAEVKDEGGLKEFRWQQTAVAGNPDILNSTVSGKTAGITPPSMVKEGDTLKAGYKYFIKTEGTTNWSSYASGGMSGIDPTTKVFTASASATGPITGTGEAYEADADGSAGCFVYKLRMELDTLSNDVANGLYNNYGTGVYQITLSATDNSEPSNTTKLTLDFQVDNSYPALRYENSTTVVGSEYYIQGYASDIPPAGKGNISKMAGVTVYFQKRKGDSSNFLAAAEQGGSLPASNGAIIDLKGNVVPKSVLKDFRVRHVNNTSTAGALEANPSLIKMPPTWFDAAGTSSGTAMSGNVKYAITIDQEEIYGGTTDSVDHDGYHESWHPEGQEQFWQVLFNSMDLPDGPLTMHFIAQDAAGNASHRTIDLIIKNKVPHLYDLELGTSLYNPSANPGDAQMAWDDIDPSAYGASLFTVRNNRLDLKASVSNGNVRNRYRVSSVEQKGPVEANTIKAGNVYTIAVNTGANFMNIGASSNNIGTTFMAVAGGGNLPASAKVFYYEAPVNPVITVGEGATLTGGTHYIIDYPGNTNWASVGAGAGPWLAGQTFTANSSAASLMDAASPGSAGTAYSASTVTVQTGSLEGYTADINPGDTLNVSFDNLKKAGTFGAAGIPDKDDGYFLIKVFDTTDPASTTVEGGQLADYILLRLDIANTDGSAPEGKFYDLNPYARNMTTGVNLNDNSGTANWGPPSIGGSRNLGGLFYTGTGAARQISGHIEPRYIADGNSAFIEDSRDTKFTVDTVSGKVILRGYAKDNQRIAEIGVRIGGTAYQTGGTYVKILETNSATGRLRAAVGANTPAGSVRVFDTLTLSGHEAEWAYIWDSAALPDTVIGNASVAVEVRDAKAAPNANADWLWAASAEADEASNRNRTYNRITVGREPYILDIVRTGRSTTRSKQGWFSLRQDSPGDGDSTPENLQIKGFNLATGTRTTGTMTTTVRFGTDNAAQAGTVTAEAPGQIDLHLPAGTKSGAVYLRAGGTALAVNNRNENLNSWNIEGTETLPWTDDRGAHIWMSYASLPGTDNGYFQGSANPKFPAMTINPADGTLWASWSQDGGQGGLWRGSNANAAGLLFTSYDPMEYTDIAYSDKAGPAISFLANISITLPPATFDGNSGGLYLHDTADNSGNNGYYGNLFPPASSQGVINGTELLIHNSSLMQFRNPRLIINGADEHLAYYDNVTNSMKYWYHLAGNNISRVNYNGTPNIRTWINIDGTTDTEDTTASAATVAYVNTSSSRHYVRSVAANGTIAKDARLYQVRTENNDNGGSQIAEVFNDTDADITWTRVNTNATVDAGATSSVLGRITLEKNSRVVTNYEDGLSRAATGNLAGQYSAIDYTSEGYPVIAYSVFSGTSTEVRLAYASVKTPVFGSQWKVQQVLKTDDVNHGTAGEYISMRINRNSDADKDRIHIAFASTNGALIYVTGTRDSFSGKYAFTPSMALDESMVGRWTDLTLDAGGKPFISYLDNARLGTANGLKMALFNAAGTDYNNAGKWETMNMPGLFAVKETRTSIEYDIQDKRSSWAAAIGYESSEGLYRIAYYVQ